MYSTSWEHFQLTLLIGTVTMGLPFTWSRTKNKVVASWQGKPRMLYLVLVLLIYISYLAYFIKFDFKKRSKDLLIMEDVIVRYVYMMGCLLAVFMYGNLFHFLDTYLFYVNEWIKLYKHIEVTYIRKDKRPWKLDCDLIIGVFSTAYLAIPFVQVCHFIKFPESKMYGYWIFKDTFIDEIVYFCHIFVVFGGLFICLCAALFHTHIYLIPISICFKTLRESRHDLRHYPTTNNNLRVANTSLHVYHCFYLNFLLGNQCISHILYYFQATASAAFIGCNCFLICFGRDLSSHISFVLFAFSFFGTLLWLTLLQAAGFVHKKTLIWLRVWKRQFVLRKKWPYHKRVKISLRPILVNVSGLYKLTLLRVAKYVNLIFRGTFKGVFVLSIK